MKSSRQNHRVRLPRSALFLVIAMLAWFGAMERAHPNGASSRSVTIFSEGTRLAGDLWRPSDAPVDAKLPALVLAHGWGGTKGHLNHAYAAPLAEAGFVVLTFDYRGWGESDGKLAAAEAVPSPGADGLVTVKARELRNVVDPFDQVEDFTHAIDFLMGEPGVDANRIGIWGTSYAGGHVVYVAAHDPRVKALVSQVGYQDSHAGVARVFAEKGGVAFARKRATQLARGEIGPLPPEEDRFPRLGGVPDISRAVDYRPIAFAERITVPTLIIDVDQEDLFDRMQHGHALYEIVKARAPARYELLPGRHYDIYSAQQEAALALALNWFKQYLMPVR